MTALPDRPAPKVAAWVAMIRVPRAHREFALGDLDEGYREQHARHGARRARAWYWRQAVLALLRTTPLGDDPGLPLHPRGETMFGIVRDCRLAVRQLRARPLLSAAAIMTLALGIGANVAMVSAAWPMLFAPLPFPDEGRLTLVSLTYERNQQQFRNPVSRGDFLDMRTASSFAGMAAFNQYTSELNLTGTGPAQQVRVGYVGANWFAVLGVRPVVGRLLQESDATSGARAIVLADSLWRDRFAADPAVVGRSLRLDGESYEVVGVAPASAGLGTVEADGWVVQPLDPTDRRRGAYFLGVVARLRPDVPLAVANQELAAIMARAAVEFPQYNATLGARADLFRDQATAPARASLVLLLVSAGLVLLVSVINLAGLQLSRFLERERERAIRRALGATRWQLARQVLVESLTLSFVGGVCSLAVALFILRTVEHIAPSFGWRHLVPVSPWLMGTCAAVIAMVTGVLVGSAPAWRAAGPQTAGALHARLATADRRSTRWRTMVVSGQVAATAVLLVVAGLVGRSQLAVLAVDPGFEFGHGLAADLNVPTGTYATVPDVTRFFDRVIAQVEAQPGVEGACAINEVPLDRGPGNMTFVAEGTTRLVGSLPSTITPGCVAVLRLPLVRGRWFTNREPEPSVVVSASMARALWPDGRNPIGQRVHFGVPSAYLLTVVGVAGDIRGGAIESRFAQQVWLPQSLGHFPPKRLLVRMTGDLDLGGDVLAAAVRAVDPDVAVARVRTMGDIVNAATASRRFAVFVLAVFAVIALVLSAVGIYGVLATVVGQRTREIGIRVALGAHAAQVARLVMSRMALAVGAGVVAGLAGARGLSALVASLLFGVGPTDVRVYLTAAVVVVLMALVAVWAPLRRAVRIDPRTAMQTD